MRVSWQNLNGAAQAFGGALASFTGPAGATYTMTDAAANYGAVANGATQPCADCYQVALSNPTTRPATHWDAATLERMTPRASTSAGCSTSATASPTSQRPVRSIRSWRLSFTTPSPAVVRPPCTVRAAPRCASRWRGVVSGCGGGSYCPGDAVTREQMAVFALRTLDAALVPPPCTTPVFSDVPAASPFCRWIEELVREAWCRAAAAGSTDPAPP